ncbi:Oxidoreductase [Ceratobasidium theobromae]|uniref:Oxidoreductase n=1 Tax=Ceratobasidium theobromae TaxID=1582974 RepID=A0A5N5QI68_9AGAM|nr:Oxidoreductase [Ceratobasidium theobromae]
MGTAYSVYRELFLPKPSWSVDQIPDLSGQVMIVTGGNAGIGRETCKALLGKGAKVYLAARNKSKAEETIEWLKNETNGKSPVFLELDLADLNSVRRAAVEFRERERELHVLFNNGGVMAPPIDRKTANGYDLQFGTNVLGHFLFTTLLLPVLIHTAQISNGQVRVVTTTSMGHRSAPKGGIDYVSIEPNSSAADEARKKLGPFVLYSQSKWGNIVFSNELHRRYRAQGIVSIAIHPDYGALTQLYAGTSVEGLEYSGKYLVPWGIVGQPRADTSSEEAGQKLWAWLEEQAKTH